MDMAGDKEIVPPEARINAMGSTEPAGNGSHEAGGSSCGLVSSLLPNSCRGRAEAFARRLHRRLTSLGDPEGPSLPGDSEITAASWIKSHHKNLDGNLTLENSENGVLQCQPSHGPESELYYDFDGYPDHEKDDRLSPTSPTEVVTAAELANLFMNHSAGLKLNNYNNCHCSKTSRCSEESKKDSESGYMYSSLDLDAIEPDEISSENNSDVYYDPDSSENDKTRTEEFFDPFYTSESDAAVSASNGVNGDGVTKPPGRRRIESSLENNMEDTSEKSENSINGYCHEKQKVNNKSGTEIVPCSSVESLNDAVFSSLDTTSPSHESLWSTFDDSTISPQDDNSLTLLSMKNHRNTNKIIFPKSFSDSELVQGNLNKTEVKPEILSCDEVDFKANEEIESRSNCCNGEKSDLLKVSEVEYYQEKTEKKEEIPENEINVRVRVDSMSKLLRKLSSSPRESIDEENKEDKQIDEYIPEDDEDEDRPRRLRRCSSLKTGKTPPGTPGRKKIVRFADVLGLDLADVRTFMDEIPKVPNSAYSDLIYDDIFQKDSSPNNLYGSSPTSTKTLIPGFCPKLPINQCSLSSDRMLVPLFQQPGIQSNFVDLVRDNQVCLQNIVVQDPITMCISGSVRVRNLDFHKSVHIRYTLDSWTNFSDLQALYVNGSCDGFSDQFTFVLYCHTLRVGQRLELAVRFQCKGVQYWDNNSGANYCFQCLPMTPAVSYLSTTTTKKNSNRHEWSPTFY